MWEATDSTLGRRVAVKCVTGVTQFPEAAGRFAREARTLAALRHGGIVTVHDAGTADHDGQALPYLVMELLDGVTWEFGRVDSVAETGARLAEVLAHVHAERIVHRDVKPADIMICADGRVVLMDFGLARDDASLTRLATATGRYLGTPAYMDPEQLQGHAATPASDVWALGVVLVEKLTGHRLPVAQLMPQVRASLPGPLRSLLDRMTSAAPGQRPTAAECAAELRASAAPTRPRRVPSTTPEWRERLVPPGVLLALYALVLFQPAYREGSWSDTVIRWFGRQINDIGEPGFTEWDPWSWGAVTSLGVAVGLAAVLGAGVLLAPGAPPATRLTGYAGAGLVLVCLVWQATSHPVFRSQGWNGSWERGIWLFYLLTALTFALFVRRDLRTRPGR